LLHLLRGGVALDELDDALEHASGLLALSGISGNVEELGASRDPAAAFALDVFAYRVAGAVAAMAVALGGLDALVFTAGIGEHSARVRRDVCARLGFLGVELDEAANARGGFELGAGRARVVVVEAREDVIAARAARTAIG
jgi:acetate kinase